MGIADALKASKAKAQKSAEEPAKEPWQAEGFAKPQWYTKPDQTITVRVVQVDKREIKKYCGRGGACHKMVNGVHTIYTERLTSDDDFINQQKLGHELHHALGMKH